MAGESVTGSAIREIAKLVEKAGEGKREAAGVVVEIEGREYTTIPLHDPRKLEKAPEVLIVHTLTGLVQYVRDNVIAAEGVRDDLQADKVMIHVNGPDEVRVMSSLVGEFRQRFAYAAAVVEDRFAGYPLFQFGRWVDAETMIIALQALFHDAADRANVLRLLGNMKAENIKTHVEDGVTQTVQTRVGVTMSDRTDVPNPVYLAAYRTFPEITQPEAPYVIRVRLAQRGDAIEVALFEADGGAWKAEATQAIAAYLRGEISDPAISILA